MKTCTKCGIPQSLDDFHRKRAHKDGRDSSCKACKKLYDAATHDPVQASRSHQQWRAANPGYTRAYNATHREQKRAISARCWATNPVRRAKHKAAETKRREANPEYFREKTRRTYAHHPEIWIAAAKRRRARINGAEVIEDFTIEEIYERDGGKCHLCGRTVRLTARSMDHLIWVSDPVYFPQAGHTRANVALAHKTCNSKRGAGRLPAQLRLF